MVGKLQSAAPGFNARPPMSTTDPSFVGGRTQSKTFFHAYLKTQKGVPGRDTPSTALRENRLLAQQLIHADRGLRASSFAHDLGGNASNGLAGRNIVEDHRPCRNTRAIANRDIAQHLCASTNQNSITNTWVRDVYTKLQYAIPNYLTPRVFNVRLSAKF